MTPGPDAAGAVAPNLLDAIADPGLVYALVFANLMSPRLWEMADRLRAGAARSSESPAAIAARHIDRHFEHVPPARLFEIYGALDLERQARRLGAATVDYAHRSVVEEFHWRRQRGLATDSLDLPRFERGEFPAFTYGTIDEIHACRRLLGRRSHKPQGLTCCVDEAALYAALLLALRWADAARLVFLIEPSHCTVMHWDAAQMHWYWRKDRQFTRESWAALVRDRYDGDVQLAFDDRLRTCDTIATARGLLTRGLALTTLDPARHGAVIDRIAGFLGAEPRQLARLRTEAAAPLAEQSFHPGDLFAALDGATSAAAIAAHVRARALDAGDPIALRALHMFRALDVPDPSIYLDAAHQSGLTDAVLPRPGALDDCLAIVRDCAGVLSVFDDRDRIALPDETMRYRTGTDRDKALLLHVLIERMDHARPQGKRLWRTLLCRGRSFVDGPNGCFEVPGLARTDRPAEPPLAILGGHDTARTKRAGGV